MTEKMKPELLSPAGSYEAFEAALGAGADAVYLGGADFGARAYAKNFDREELLRAIDTAHIHGKKLYLTVNTLVKNRELEERLYEYLLPYYRAGLDAVIVQDLGVLRFIRRTFPGLPIHASTQMAMTGPKGMKFLEGLGVTRVVPARELGLSELSAMHRESPIEIEAFIHGALCYSISGQCLMSSILGGRSGNRGRCAQPCRLSYRVREGGTPYRQTKEKEFCPLSLKDICTLDILPEILEAGVISLKIEGRMKQPEYTAGVTAMYRKYLDLYEQNREHYRVEERDRNALLNIFNRGGSCQGYYTQQNGPSMMAFSNEKKTGDAAVELKKKKRGICGMLTLEPGCPAILEVSCLEEMSCPEETPAGKIDSGKIPGREISVVVSQGEVQEAKDRPMDQERIRQQMEKLGNTEFQWDSLDIQMGERIFVPVRLLNELRREALAALTEELLKSYRRPEPNPPAYEPYLAQSSVREDKIHLYASCETPEQAEALAEDPELTGMYVNYDSMKRLMEQGVQHDKELYLALPHVVRGAVPDGYLDTAKQWLENGMEGFLVRNLEAYGILKEAGLSHFCVADASLYTWNNEAVAFWQEEGILRTTMPLELNEKELRHRNNAKSECLVYGFLPLMLSAQCVRKNTLRCDRAEARMILRDRYDKEFSCQCVCHPWKTGTTEKNAPCYNILYNSIPYGLLKESRKVRALGADCLRLSFTMETPKEAKRILEEFAAVYLHGEAPADRTFTGGHFKRGAE